jgi:hypothetical protein
MLISRIFSVIVTLLVGLIAPFWIVIATFFYTVAANGFFLVFIIYLQKWF